MASVWKNNNAVTSVQPGLEPTTYEPFCTLIEKISADLMDAPAYNFFVWTPNTRMR